MLRKTLLACGVLSALLYVAMLVFIPAQWQGYSSAAQTVSELSAIDAPTRSLWVPLGAVWTLLYAAFGWAVWQSAGSRRGLRVVGILIFVAGVLGLFWPPMHQRDVLAAGGGTLTDSLHIVWTAVNGVLTLLAMGFAAAAFGRRFRFYSIVTMVIVVAAAALTSLDAPRIQANLATPWVGVWERVNIAVWLLWVVVLAIALLRRRAGPETKPATREAKPRIGGVVAPGFEEVRVEFERNFANRGEIGAAVAAYWRGEKVVDLWGGRRTPDGEEPWSRDTMVVVMSTTKGLSAMTLALANARGWLDYDAPVASYWPEFAQHGKADVTVRQLLGHEAGLVLLDEHLTVEKLSDLDYMARLLARQQPAWAPGTQHGYHTMTLGLYMQELIRRVDPAHRSLGRFFRDEIAAPLGLEFYIGLPREIPDARVAKVKPLSKWRGFLALRYTPPAVTLKMIRPGSLLRRSFVGLGVDPNDRQYLDVEVPAGNGVGTARAIARAYSCFAEGGAELGISPKTFARVITPPVVHGDRDVVLGVPSYFSLGFLRPGPTVAFGSSPRAFGSPGAGGSFAFADPDARLGYAYVMNKLDFYLENDPREKALRDAVYRAMARQRSRPRTVEVVGA
ncbi:MAG TPA: serine hydrolase [Gemmatimonadales bacterium]|nr:serine hydrolase [Gemmatimonadales bacterium]